MFLEHTFYILLHFSDVTFNISLILFLYNLDNTAMSCCSVLGSPADVKDHSVTQFSGVALVFFCCSRKTGVHILNVILFFCPVFCFVLLWFRVLP